VDWVIQFDPPQKPDAFVHRCGRTARNGKNGRALVFLQPEEETYAEFLNIRKVPMTRMEPVEIDAGSPIRECLADLRKRAREDREIYERGRVAFVSYVRGYKEHQCS
jgi:ATP-dependent RNA helicase DDX55/SPB4